MSYIAKGSSNNNNNNQKVNNNSGYYPKNSKKLYNSNGYNATNNYKNRSGYGNTDQSASIQNTLEKVKQNQKKQQARKAIKEGLSHINPAAGVVADKMLKTEAGDKLVDAYAKADNPVEGMQNVKKEIKKQTTKLKIIGIGIGFFVFFLFIVLIASIFIKNADSLIFGNKNAGNYESEYYVNGVKDEKILNVFANYPGLYEKIVEKADELSNNEDYLIEIDKFLIIATLIAPLKNDYIVPVDDHSCGEEKCYYFYNWESDKTETLTWTQFLDKWGDLTTLLGKMQVMTTLNPDNDPKINLTCKEEKNIETYAKNDKTAERRGALWFLNPVNWFKEFSNNVEAEVNAKCTEVREDEQEMPTVRTLSTNLGKHYLSTYDANNSIYEKDSNTGGVYFWNLTNKDGFLYTYLKDYLSTEYKDDPDKNYEINKQKILEIGNYIYDYYEEIKKSCDSHKILKSSIEKINVTNPSEKQSRYGVGASEQVDFEDQYIGGVILAEFSNTNLEGLKAFAVLVRTEAVANVGLDGSGSIENSSKKQNYNPNYSPEKYPLIAQAVKETRGQVITHINSAEIWHTEYDAFCPTRSFEVNGFYYLDDDQQKLPINPSDFYKKTGEIFIDPNSEYLDCPCFQNPDSRPKDDDTPPSVRFRPKDIVPTDVGGDPPQETKEVCWNENGQSKYDNDDKVWKYGWDYHVTGGHGRGASQYGIRYFAAFDYSYDAIIRLFFKDAQLRVLSSSLEDQKCSSVAYYLGNETYDNYLDYEIPNNN